MNSLKDQEKECQQFFLSLLQNEFHSIENSIDQLETVSKILMRCNSKPDKIDILSKEIKSQNLVEYIQTSPDNCKNISKCFQKKIQELKLEQEKINKTKSGVSFEISKFYLEDYVNKKAELSTNYNYVIFENLTNNEYDDSLFFKSTLLYFTVINPSLNAIDLIVLIYNLRLTFHQIEYLLNFTPSNSILKLKYEEYLEERSVDNEDILQLFNIKKFVEDIESGGKEILKVYSSGGSMYIGEESLSMGDMQCQFNLNFLLVEDFEKIQKIFKEKNYTKNLMKTNNVKGLKLILELE